VRFSVHTTLWHIDAAERAPSTASIATDQFNASFYHCSLLLIADKNGLSGLSALYIKSGSQPSKIKSENCRMQMPTGSNLLVFHSFIAPVIAET